MAKVYYNMNGRDVPWLYTPETSTTNSSGEVTLSGIVPRIYNEAMFGYYYNGSYVYPGSKLTGIQSDMTLYAQWEEAQTYLSLNSSHTWEIYFPKQRRVYKFTAPYTGEFKVSATHEDNADLVVYNSSGTELGSDDGWLSDDDAEVIFSLSKGEVCYIHASILYADVYKNPGVTTQGEKLTTTLVGKHQAYYHDGDGTIRQTSYWHETVVGTTINANIDFISDPVRTGYKFLGWYTSSVGGNRIIEHKMVGDKHFYAHWQKLEYNMTIKPDGGVLFKGTSLETSGNNSLTAKFAYQVPTFIGKLINNSIYGNEPTKPGNVFLKWQSNYGTAFKNTSGKTMYFNGETPSENNGYATGNYWAFDGNYQGAVTITAKWHIKRLTVQFNSNYPTTKTNETYSQIFEYAKSNNRFGYDTNGTKLSPTVPNFYKEKFGFVDFFCYGYKIIGWSTNPNATTPEFETFHKVEDTWIDANVTSADGNTINLYAIWDYNGLVRVYHDGEWKMALAYIYDGTAWQHTLPQIYNGKDWKLGI